MSSRKRRPGSILCIGNEPVQLNLRCFLLKEHGWRVLSSGSGHEGLLRIRTEATVDGVVLDLDLGSDGSESALIAGQLKRMCSQAWVIVVVPDGEVLAEGALLKADAVVARSEESKKLMEAIERLALRSP